jgi:hypothetical protein
VRHRHEWQRQWVELLRLRDLLGAASAEEAMRRPGAVEIRLLRDLGIAELVLVAGSDVHNAGRACRLDELSHRRSRLLSTGEVKPAAGLDEIDLRIDIPEDRPAHHTTLEDLSR